MRAILQSVLGACVAIALSSLAHAQSTQCVVGLAKEDALKSWLITQSTPLVGECKDCDIELVIIAQASPEQGAPPTRKARGVESKEIADEVDASSVSRERFVTALRRTAQRETPDCRFTFDFEGHKIIDGIHFFVGRYRRECSVAPQYMNASEWRALDRGCLFRITIASRYSGAYQPEPLSMETQAKIQAYLGQIRLRSP